MTLSFTNSHDAELTMESETLATFVLTFDAASDPPFMHVSRVDVPRSHLDVAAFAAQRVRFTPVDGGAFVTLVLPWRNAEPETENIRLYGGPDRLSGTVGP